MTEEDRKKIFWYLKRKTSYTALKREADAFDCFADVFEKQVREEPRANGPNNLFGPMDWEELYPEILNGQVLYEKALSQLKQGDRTIWLYNERGLMGDARTISSSWHNKMVNDEQYVYGNGMGHSLDGKYVGEMIKVLEAWFVSADDTGYFQPRFADRPAPESWTTFWYDTYAKLPLPMHLPEVPIPEKEVLIRTGQEVPVFGIYEPQLKDGCMNYLLGGIPAPEYEPTDGTYATTQHPVTWRLIWEDTRYLDGHVSSEEDFYFPASNQAVTPTAAAASDDLLFAATGQKCPKDGNWAVMNDLQGKINLKKGDKMPQYQGRDVAWVWSA